MKKNIWFYLFTLLLVICLAIGCVHKQEQFKYEIIKRTLPKFELTARLDGTYYGKRAGDIDVPYTLTLYLSSTNGNRLTIKKLSLSVLDGAEVFQSIAPHMEAFKDCSTVYVKIQDLDLEYQEYVLKFWLEGDDSPVQYEFILKKDYSFQYTTIWLEALKSV
jgi:hypothetical protein